MKVSSYCFKSLNISKKYINNMSLISLVHLPGAWVFRYSETVTEKSKFLCKAITLILIISLILLERRSVGVENGVQKENWVQGNWGVFAKFRSPKEERRRHIIKMIVLKSTDDINSGGQAYIKHNKINKCDWSYGIKLALPLTY